jgi:uncharacterized protein (TIGR03067 family)
MRKCISVAAMIACIVIPSPASAAPVARPAGKDTTSHWEHRAEAFGADAKEATRILNRLAADGWEYVGPLGNGLVAFKKYFPSQRESAAKKELSKWEGSWDGGDGVAMTIKGDRFWSRAAGVGDRNGTIRIVKVDAKVTLVDLLVEEGDVKGQTFKAIFRIDGDTLHYCGTFGEVRPVEFETQGDTYYVVWKRAKKSDQRVQP